MFGVGVGGSYSVCDLPFAAALRSSAPTLISIYLSLSL